MKNNLPTVLQYLNEGFSVIPLYSLEMVQGNPPRKFFEELEEKIEKNRISKEVLPEETVRKKLIIDWCKRPCFNSWTKYQTDL